MLRSHIAIDGSRSVGRHNRDYLQQWRGKILLNQRLLERRKKKRVPMLLIAADGLSSRSLRVTRKLGF